MGNIVPPLSLRSNVALLFHLLCHGLQETVLPHSASANVGATETKRSLGLSIAVSAGNSLPIAIPWTFPASHAPDYFLGFALCTGFLVFGALLAIALHVYCRWENARSDHEYGDASMEERVLSDDDVRFRYFY